MDQPTAFRATLEAYKTGLKEDPNVVAEKNLPSGRV
jgi:hypothetical protein